MPIGPVSATGYSFSARTEPARPARAFTKRLNHYMRSFDVSYERVAKVRAKVLNRTGHVHSFDRGLSFPEQFRNPGIRALIHAAKHLEEIAEGISDISGLTERVTRNIISSGEKPDIALVIASAVGRILSGFMSAPGFAVHKAIGLGFFGVSTILSMAALGLIKAGLGEKRTEIEIADALKKSNFDSSAYLFIARKLLARKEKMLETILDRTDTSTSKPSSAIQRWAKYMSRKQSSVPAHLVSKRKANCNYIWQNLHQYGPVTRSLMHIAYGTFQGVNKLGGSFDKHLGAAIGRNILRHKLGGILGGRVGMAVGTGMAVAISIPLAPLVVSVSSISAMACSVALLALVLAKLNVQLTNDWEGNIQKPLRRQVLGRVTPT
ncbi:MAG: hypothetical protein LW710_11070 [Burkholderiales bacterium]|jgi:hypothetical protein|uniref:hypothetical protein n=1 Tax=Limnobacter sp. TaxID=2003368 RepID=UPI0039BC724A|nr:hypothetical protein [Burkholderiales bacterium]